MHSMKRTYITFIIFILSIASLCAKAVAASDPSLYRAQLPLASAESQPSNDELKMALAQVLSKLTNIPDIDKAPTWASSLTHAKEWMASYQYITAGNGGQLILQVDFDPTAINQLLKSKGQNVPTSGPSQQLLIWLVVENGEAPQLLGSASPYAKIIDAAAKQNALNIEWPLLDLSDLKALNAEAAREGDWTSIDAASKRYTHDSILLVHLSKGEGAQALWTSEWTLRAVKQNSDWAFSANDAAAALRGGMAELSSLMAQGAKTNVVSQSALPISPVQVIVYGVGDLTALGGLKNNLQQLTPVQDIEVVEVSPDEVILNINAQGGSAALQQAIADQMPTLVATEASDQNSPSGALVYQWTP
jgi:hypothetical protein